MNLLKPNLPIEHLIQYLSDFASERTKFFIDGVNTPSIEEQKNLLRYLQD